MEIINCRTGMTKIGRVLLPRGGRLQALVFVGDALYAGALGLPEFLFQEGDDREVTRTLHEIRKCILKAIHAMRPIHF